MHGEQYMQMRSAALLWAHQAAGQHPGGRAAHKYLTMQARESTDVVVGDVADLLFQLGKPLLQRRPWLHLQLLQGALLLQQAQHRRECERVISCSHACRAAQQQQTGVLGRQ